MPESAKGTALESNPQPRVSHCTKSRSFTTSPRRLHIWKSFPGVFVFLFSVVCPDSVTLLPQGSVCRGSSTGRDPTGRFRGLAVLGCSLDSVRRWQTEGCWPGGYPPTLCPTLWKALGSSFSTRLEHPQWRKERYCRSFLPTPVRLFNQYLSHHPTTPSRGNGHAIHVQYSGDARVYRVSHVFIFSKVFYIYFFFVCCCWDTLISPLRDDKQNSIQFFTDFRKYHFARMFTQPHARAHRLPSVLYFKSTPPHIYNHAVRAPVAVIALRVSFN